MKPTSTTCIVFVSLALAATVVPGCTRQSTIESHGSVAGYHIDLQFPSADIPIGDTRPDEILIELAARADALDPIEGSVLGRLNSSDVGELIPASPVEDSLSNVLSYSRQCFGAFDPTLQILWDVYDFETGGRRVRESEIDDALQWVDMSQIEMEPGSILRLGEHARMGLGPTLPGAITDWTVYLLAEKEIDSAVVRVGQCFTSIGEIEEADRTYEFLYPLDAITEDDLQLTMGFIRLEPGEYLAALDDDEKFFFSRGELYHMILDPTTGRPVFHIRAAVIVSSESCLQASVFAYAVMVMGLERGLEFIDETESIEGLILDRDHQVHVSGGLADRFWR